MGIFKWLLGGEDDDDDTYSGPPDPPGDREENDTEFLADLFGDED